MVKAELSIEFSKDKQLHIGLDLLKREDWTEEEFTLAESLQQSLLMLIDIMKDTKLVEETKREIIKSFSPK
jgi:hypothetical protein